MLLGDELISIDHLIQLIESSSKMNHNLVNRNNSNNTNTNFLLPRHHKLSKTIDSKQISSLSFSTVSLSLEAIENTILRAYSDVCSLVVDMNICQQDQVLPLEKMSRLANLQLMKSRIVDYSCPDKYDSDFDSDSDDSNSEGDDEITANDADDEDSFDDDNDLSDNLVNISASTFHGMRVFDWINPTLAKSYFIVNINGTKKYLHKQTAAWLLSKDKPTLSSDRLKRVMTNNK
ncbi:unnamed protein product [Rotaria sordida]|uniref:Uncharacterized protein n=1 Tax=Rotaria sordida TaxID=392033 RepID=A0A814U6M4_9BILA|nr:unnamed protein product [Rotaria sordida]CAF1420287.1 unnamed protein product [Rotaria sordida]